LKPKGRSLAIPPAWERVWIYPRGNGHLQAIGIDARGRKQYKYHPSWPAVGDEAKFEKLLSFAEALPKIRAQVDEDMRRPNLTREKVLATVVRLLEVSLIRIGNEEYAKENKSFGLDGTLARTLRVKANSHIAHHLPELKPEEAAVLALLRQESAQRSEKDRPPRGS
jgi:DNA topoisomerase I